MPPSLRPSVSSAPSGPSSARLFQRPLDSDATGIGLVTLGWIAIVLVLGPIGEFPLNDDWVYAKSVQSIVQNGRFHLLDWSQALGIPQAWLGAAVSEAFGFSFTSLRILGLTMGWVGLLSTYLLAKELGAGPPAATIVAAAMAANPLYVALAGTFMTDVPFYAFATLSLALLVRGFRNSSPLWLVAGLVAAVPAILTRQLGLVIPLGFAVAYGLGRPLNGRVLAVAGAPLVLAIVMHLSVDAWLGSGRQDMSSFGSIGDRLAQVAQKLVSSSLPGPKNVLLILQYAGFFAFPSAWLWMRIRLSESDTTERRRFALQLLGWTSALLLPVVAKSLVMPSVDNRNAARGVWKAHGIGPLTLKDTFVLNTNQVEIPQWLDGLWWLVTAISVVGAALIAMRGWAGLRALFDTRVAPRRARIEPAALLLMAVTLIYIVLVSFVVPGYADRYVLLCLPMAHALFLTHRSALKIDDDRASMSLFRPLTVSVGLVVTLAVFSALASRDHLEFNRKRWLALDTLTRVQHIAPTRIDGGYEFNGWHLYRPGGARFEDRPRSWWWVTDDEYIVASGPIDGYREVASYPFRRWLLGGHVSRIVVLKRLDASGR